MRDIHRPELHVTAETGVLDAPAGVLNDHGTWHMFYQFQPTLGEPARWGHALGCEGPFDWIDCDDVLAAEGEESTIRAGSVVAEGNHVGVYFTVGYGSRSEIHYADYSNLASTCEVSDVPSTIDHAMIRHGAVITDREDVRNFRSPAVVPGWEREYDRNAGHSGWLMLAVTGETGSPTPVILSSDDGRHWTYEGPLLFDGDTGLDNLHAIAAPRIMRLRDHIDNSVYDVLLLTLEREGIDHSGYLVGELTGRTFKVLHPFRRIDYGHDFTRPRSAAFTPGTIDEDARNDDAVVFGLLNGIGRQDDPSTHRSLRTGDWANALSLPRSVTLQNGILYQTPLPGLIDAVTASEQARIWSGLCAIPAGSTLKLTLRDAHGTPAATVTHAGYSLTLDRLQPEGSEPAVAPLREDDSDSLTVIVDGSTVEVFADGGQIAMASRVYFEGGCSGVEVTTDGDAIIERSWQQVGAG